MWDCFACTLCQHITQRYGNRLCSVLSCLLLLLLLLLLFLLRPLPLLLLLLLLLLLFCCLVKKLELLTVVVRLMVMTPAYQLNGTIDGPQKELGTRPAVGHIEVVELWEIVVSDIFD